VSSVAEARAAAAQGAGERNRALRTLHGLATAAPAPETHRARARRFFAGNAWRRLRYSVLRAAGARCACCGRRAGNGVALHIDHIEPLSKNWERRLDPSNLQCLCADCNMGKSNTDSIDWRAEESNGAT
jgi:5-methylcytosine-specific restriction endonuclease McrA